MSEIATPREVFEKLLAGIAAGRWADLGELYAEEAVVEIPFSPFPPRRLDGRAALLARFEELGGTSPFEMRAENVVVHQVDDPEVVIAEFDWVGRHVASGRTFEAPNIQVLRVRDGKIVSTRDYHHHAVIAAATGTLEQFADAFRP
ncbi:nuclear transport factor 2 family protein [Kitasatospora sp. NPDC058965]|uniref:nuclear transport factor 2 family protein n=1 Tax=Kitasatospora sp. NPDC058965 TaxID=3346682 RepID=UPI0036BBCB27